MASLAQDIVFVSSPYTHDDKEVLEQRVRDVTKYSAHLLNRSVQAFSPIVYGHVVAVAHDLPGDWQFWQAFCETYLSRSAVMHVLCLDGWKQSTGIGGEIAFCEANSIPYVFINAETYVEFVPKDL